MSLSLTPSKRQHYQNSKESNGKKFQKTSSFDSPKEPRGDVFRVLCPSSKIGLVIGQEQNIISHILKETGAKVRVGDPVSGCDERVIFIMGLYKENQASPKGSNDEDPGSELSKDQIDAKDHMDNDAGKGTIQTTVHPQSDKGTPSLRQALLLVFEKFIEAEKETEETNKEGNGSGTVTFRLLVLSSQVGCLLGAGGSIIKRMSAESGAQIRVLPKDKLPQCASAGDDVVQITGGLDAVKKAILSVSHQIVKNASVDHDSPISNPRGPALDSPSQPFPKPESNTNRSLPFRGGSRGGGFRDNAELHSSVPFFNKFGENFMPNRMDVPEMVTFRLLCPGERVGGVIGRGGATIKTLQRESHCEIKVLEGISDGEERIIVVSGLAHLDDRISPVQDAVLRVQHRIAKAIPYIKEKGVTTKLIVPSNQIGYLLGKGGSIISEIRKVTGAYIQIMEKNQISKNALDDEVVQINGELEVVQEALLQITTRLQHLFFRDTFPSINHPSSSAFPDRMVAFPSSMERREHSPSGMFPKFGAPFRNFDSIGAPALHGGLHPRDDHPAFMHNANSQGIMERPWRHQTSMEGGRVGLLDYIEPQQSRMSGFGGGSQQAMITNTTVEVVVPSSVIPSIYGDEGGCFRQIHQISDAKITITDPKPGAPETLIIISGTPEQTHAAQSLIQAFVMIENESSR